MKQMNFGVDDLTKSALKRLVAQLLAASDGEEQKLLADMTRQRKKEDKEMNDLADLDEEMHGKPKTPKVKKDDMEDGDT